MGVQIKIGYTSDDPRKLDKSYTLDDAITCRIKGDCNIEEPVFILNAKDKYINSNYVYCETWDKYYFINKQPTVSEGGTMEISCTEDVLMSWKDTISGSEQIISRQENNYSDFLADNMLPLKCKNKYKVKSFGDSVKTTEHFILGVI